MLACKRGHEEVVRVLLTAGAELHQKDSRGRTARDTASKRSHETILAMLHPSKQMRLMQVRGAYLGDSSCRLWAMSVFCLVSSKAQYFKYKTFCDMKFTPTE